MDYGTPEMLKLFGFEFVEKSDSFKNYDPKRFNQLWRKDDVEMFSDNSTLLSKDGRYVYHFGKGDETSIETYFEVPKELEYLKTKSSSEAWRLLSKSKIKSELGYILGSRYDFDREDMYEEIAKIRGEAIVVVQPKVLHKKYFSNMEMFGDKIVELINISHNLHPMSGQFSPHVLYLTPQCGEYEQHQLILDKFAEINRSYVNKYNEE
jgi:hypothetical protein